MRAKSTIERYGYYQTYIQLLAKFSLQVEPTMAELGLVKEGRGVVQRAYKEMKQDHFPGTIIHFLSLIGGMFELEMRIKDGSIFDWPKLIAYLEKQPESAATIIRATKYIRISDINHLYEMSGDSERSNLLYQSVWKLGQLGRSIENGQLESKELELNRLTKRILEYQAVTPGLNASSTNPQPPPTNQRKQTPATTRAKGKP